MPNTTLRYVDLDGILKLYRVDRIAEMRRVWTLASSINTWGDLRVLIEGEPEVGLEILEVAFRQNGGHEYDDEDLETNLIIDDSPSLVMLENHGDDDSLTVDLFGDDHGFQIVDFFDPSNAGVPATIVQKFYKTASNPFAEKSWLECEADIDEIRAALTEIGWSLEEGTEAELMFG